MGCIIIKNLKYCDDIDEVRCRVSAKYELQTIFGCRNVS